MQKDSRIYVAGHRGLVGSAIVRELNRKGYSNIYPKDDKRCDLANQYETFSLFTSMNPEYVFNCAARTGGINEAITKPAEMLEDNLLIQTHILSSALTVEVKKLLNFGSSCIYPVDGHQPYREEQIGAGKTDENWSYAIAKLAGIELCRAYHRQYKSNFLSVIPCNVYGLNDNFEPAKSHVIPALIRKYHEAKDTITLWGSGHARREFIYSDDLAEICVSLMENNDYDDLCDGVINVGTGEDITINALMAIISDITDKHPTILYDPTKPNGVRSKLMDVSKMAWFGLEAKTSLEEGIKRVYEWYKDRAHN